MKTKPTQTRQQAHIERRILEFAEYLGWPAGISACEGEITVPGGDEAGWREWLAAFPSSEGDVAMFVLEVLWWAARTIVLDDDPGPPETWGAQYQAAQEIDNEIIELHEDGRSAREIAQALALPLLQVELAILDL